MKKINFLVLLSALVVITGFFLPWLSYGEDGDYATGFTLAKLRGDSYMFAMILPAAAFFAGVLAVRFKRAAAFFAALTGACAIGWGLFEIVRFLHTQTFAGLWVTVLGAIMLFATGLVTGNWRRDSTDTPDNDEKKQLASDTDTSILTDVPRTGSTPLDADKFGK